MERDINIYWIEDRIFIEEPEPELKLTSDYKKEIKHQQGCRCGLCGQIYKERSLFIHHKQPKSQGGSNQRSNLVALCTPCHNYCDDLALNENIYYGTEEFISEYQSLDKKINSGL